MKRSNVNIFHIRQGHLKFGVFKVPNTCGRDYNTTGCFGLCFNWYNFKVTSIDNAVIFIIQSF